MLFCANNSMKLQHGVFAKQAAALATLTRQVKLAFDPKGFLNPCRMYREF
jgi:FAD/FMN-containing dehydrogenase